MKKITEFTPFVGIDKLRFGDSRKMVRGMISGACKPFKKTPLSKNYTDAFSDAGFHVYYDESDNVELIEVFSPAIVEYSGVVLSQGNRSEIEGELKRKDSNRPTS